MKITFSTMSSSVKLLVILAFLIITQILLTACQDDYHDGKEFIQQCPLCSWGEEPSIPCGKTTKEILLSSPPECRTCMEGFYQRFNFSTGQCRKCTKPTDRNLVVKVECDVRHQGTYDCRDGFFEDHNSDCRDCCDKDYAMRNKRIQKCKTYISKECPEVLDSRTSKLNSTFPPKLNSTYPPEATETPEDDYSTKIIIASVVIGFIFLVLLAVLCCCRRRLGLSRTSLDIEQQTVRLRLTSSFEEQQIGLPPSSSFWCRIADFFRQVHKTIWSAPVASNESRASVQDCEVNTTESLSQTDGEACVILGSNPDFEVETTELLSQADGEAGVILASNADCEVETTELLSQADGEAGVILASNQHCEIETTEPLSQTDGEAGDILGGEKCHASPSNEIELPEFYGDTNVSYHKDKAEAMQSTFKDFPADVGQEGNDNASDSCHESKAEAMHSEENRPADVRQERGDDASDNRKKENEVMIRMAEDLTKYDVKKIKMLHNNEIGEGVLEGATDALDLLQLLKERGKVEDVNGFCDIFEAIGRKDLVSKYGKKEN